MSESVGTKLANLCRWSYGSLKLRDLIVNGLTSCNCECGSHSTMFSVNQQTAVKYKI